MLKFVLQNQFPLCDSAMSMGIRVNIIYTWIKAVKRKHFQNKRFFHRKISRYFFVKHI